MTVLLLLGLTEPVLIRLDVDSKLNEQIKVDYHLWHRAFRFSGVNL